MNKSIVSFTWKTIQNEFHTNNNFSINDIEENPYKLIHKNPYKNLHSHLYPIHDKEKINNETNIQNFQLDLYRSHNASIKDNIIDKKINKNYTKHNIKESNNIISNQILPKQEISIPSENDIENINNSNTALIINYPKQKRPRYHIDLESIPKITFFYCYQNNILHHLELNFFENWNYYGDNTNTHNYQYIYKVLSKYMKLNKSQYSLLINKQDINTFCTIIDSTHKDLQKLSNIKFINEYKLLETNIYFKKYKKNILISFQSAHNSLNTKQFTISNWDNFNNIITQLNSIKENYHFLFNIDILLDYAILYYHIN